MRCGIRSCVFPYSRVHSKARAGLHWRPYPLLACALTALLAYGPLSGTTEALATCNANATPPPDFNITSQAVTLNLDTDCAGAPATASADVGVGQAVTTAAGDGINNNAGGSLWTLSNQGTVSAPGDAVRLNNGGTVVNEAGGLIEGLGMTAASDSDGIIIFGGMGTVTNRGMVRAGDEGVQLTAGGSVVNAAGATIAGGRDGPVGTPAFGVAITAGNGNVDNSGVISTGGGDGVSMFGGGTLTLNNRAGAMITANRFSVSTFTAAQAILNNFGTITGARAFQFDNANAVNDTVTLFGGSTTNGLKNFGLGDDMVTVFGGASFTGAFDGQGGNDTMALSNAAGENDIFDLDQSPITGFEQINKLGDGTWTFIGDGVGTTANFSAQGGTTNVNGNFPNVAFTVTSGATVGGTGVLGSLVANGGSAVAPGVSIGTLTTNGNYTAQPGSRYQVEVNAAGGADLLDVRGTATLNGGTVEVTTLGSGQNFTNGQQWVIVDTTGGLTGVYDGVTDNSAVLDFSLAYNATQALLVLGQAPVDAPATVLLNRRVINVSVVAHNNLVAQRQNTGNPVGVCPAALNSMGFAPAEFTSLAFASAQPERPFGTKALAALPNLCAPEASSESQATQSGTKLAASETAPENTTGFGFGRSGGLLKRIPMQKPWTTFAAVSGGTGDFEAVGNQGGGDFETVNFASGVDYFIKSNAILGLSTGYGRTDSDNAGTNGGAQSDSFTLGAHGSVLFTSNIYGNAAASHTWSDTDQSRAAEGGGFATSNTDAETTLVSATLGGDFPVGARRKVLLGGFFGANATWTHIDASSETVSTTSVGFTTPEQDTNSVKLQAGGRIVVPHKVRFGPLDEGLLILQLRGTVSHELTDQGDVVSVLPVGGVTPVVTPVQAPDETEYNVATGAGLSIPRFLANVGGEVSASFTDDNFRSLVASVNGRIRF